VKVSCWSFPHAPATEAPQSIEWDGDKEQIINDPKANELLQRPYRAPWKYPAV
jgi:hypothetical protein